MWICTVPHCEHTSKVLRYGTHSQGISQFYLHTPRSSTNGCLFLSSWTWYSFTDPRGMEGWVGLGGWLHTKINVQHRELKTDTVTRLSTNRDQRKLILLIKTNVLPLCQTTTRSEMKWMFSTCYRCAGHNESRRAASVHDLSQLSPQTPAHTLQHFSARNNRPTTLAKYWKDHQSIKHKMKNCNLCQPSNVFVSVFYISSILYCTFIFCIIVTNLALWLQDVNKLTYLQ